MKINVTIEGKTPLLCNRFGDQEQMDATNGTRLVNKGERGSPKEQAEKKLYLGCDGKTLMIPQPNMFRCIIDAGKFFKNGKSKVTTVKTSLIPACLELAGHDNPLEIPVISKDGWTVDTRAVRIPATGGRIQAHRPCFHDWQLSFLLELDETEMSEKLLRDIVDAAGKKIGLGDFRPDCKGPFGKFVVIEWKKLK
jgi:hypothetical protein